MLSQFLDFEAIRIDLSAATSASCSTNWRRSPAQRLALDPAVIADAIAERERLGSTGFGGGVAIPHGKLDGLDRVYALFARLAEPVDYKAIDGGRSTWSSCCCPRPTPAPSI